MCPPRVTGVDCGTCLPFTFGFDPLIGCEDCDCDPQGVVGGNLACDINTGATGGVTGHVAVSLST